MNKILHLVELGKDLSTEEQLIVTTLVRKFTDIFTLSVHEVKHIPGAIHQLHMPEGTQLNTKIGQKPLTPPQAAYFSKVLDVMITAVYVNQ